MVDGDSLCSPAKSRKFRVIIKGGSIAGLALALTLEKCGIDYVLIEKRTIAPHQGQSIFLVPCTTLVLEQLNVSQAILKDAFPLSHRHHRNEKMKVFCLSDDIKRLAEK